MPACSIPRVPLRPTGGLKHPRRDRDEVGAKQVWDEVATRVYMCMSDMDLTSSQKRDEVALKRRRFERDGRGTRWDEAILRGFSPRPKNARSRDEVENRPKFRKHGGPTSSRPISTGYSLRFSQKAQ